MGIGIRIGSWRLGLGTELGDLGMCIGIGYRDRVFGIGDLNMDWELGLCIGIEDLVSGL